VELLNYILNFNPSLIDSGNEMNVRLLKKANFQKYSVEKHDVIFGHMVKYSIRESIYIYVCYMYNVGDLNMRSIYGKFVHEKPIQLGKFSISHCRHTSRFSQIIIKQKSEDIVI
jgi:hypothetical protein